MSRLVLLLAVLVIGACTRSRDVAPYAPDVVVVLVDTLRADHLGCYGYELDTSPELDDFAAAATVFERHTAQCNSTGPSILSILTGVHPRTHLLYDDVPLGEASGASRDLRNLAELLGEKDYACVALWSHPMWRLRGDGNTFERGWERYATVDPSLDLDARLEAGDATHMTDRALAAVDDHAEQTGDRPLCLLVHYFDPHAPYDPPDGDRDRFLDQHLRALDVARHADLARGRAFERVGRLPGLRAGEAARLRTALGRSRYDEEVRDLSRQVGRLFDGLRERGRFDDALVVFLADHGENMEPPEAPLRSAGNFTHTGLYESVIATPLVVKLPGQNAGRRIAALSQNLDVLPTILDVAGLPPSGQFEGTSLLPLLEGTTDRLHEVVFSESSDMLAAAVKTAELKLIQGTPEASGEVFRWTDDRLELAPRTVTPGTRGGDLVAALTAFRPRQRLAFELAPGDAPYPAELVVRVEDTELSEDANADWRLDATRREARWSGVVGPTGARLELQLARALPSAEVVVALGGTGAAQDRVRLGDVPLAASRAFPRYERLAEGGSNLDAPVVLAVDPSARTLVLRRDGAVPARLELEVTQASAFYGEHVRQTAADGFTAPTPVGRPPSARSALTTCTDAAGTARIEFEGREGSGPLRYRVTCDERWIAPDLVSFCGRGLPSDRTAFGWDRPLDDGLVRALATRPAAVAPPGCLRVSYVTSSGDLPARGSAVDARTLADLQRLGYAE